MEIFSKLKVFFTFTILQNTCVLSLSESHEISQRLNFLEEMLTEMEYIVGETDAKVSNAQRKLLDTENTLERDFVRLKRSDERKVRKKFGKIMSEIRQELKYDSHVIKELLESIENINLKEVGDQKGNIDKSGLENLDNQPDESLDHDKAHKEDISVSRVMFKAANLTKQQYVDGETIIFPEIVYNIEEGYDPINGLFVTPVAGTYYFTAQLYISGGFNTDVGIYVDDECIAWAKFTPSRNSCENFAVVVTLKLGDVVYVKQISKARPDTYQTTATALFNSFSGVFIR